MPPVKKPLTFTRAVMALRGKADTTPIDLDHVVADVEERLEALCPKVQDLVVQEAAVRAEHAAAMAQARAELDAASANHERVKEEAERAIAASDAERGRMRERNAEAKAPVRAAERALVEARQTLEYTGVWKRLVEFSRVYMRSGDHKLKYDDPNKQIYIGLPFDLFSGGTVTMTVTTREFALVVEMLRNIRFSPNSERPMRMGIRMGLFNAVYSEKQRKTPRDDFPNWF
jgi:hypothetical protein